MIGNKFYLPNGEVGTISYHEIRLLVVSQEKPNYQPITLTEEWLLKFGFEKRSIIQENDSYYLNGEIVWVTKKGFRYFQNRNIIQHVHQLQNLYFALTGEELTIKDNE